MNFNHTLYKNADSAAFKRVTGLLSRMRKISKIKVLEDVDGSLCAIFSIDDTEFAINKDNEIDSIYVSSTKKLPDDFLQKLSDVADNISSVEKARVIYAIPVTIKDLSERQFIYIDRDRDRIPARVARNPVTGEVIRVKPGIGKKIRIDKKELNNKDNGTKRSGK